MMRMLKGTTVVAASALLALAWSNADARTWQEVQAAAKREGTVVVAGPSFPWLRDAVVKNFQKDTGIKLEWKPLVGGPGPFTAKFKREMQAGKVSTDVYIGGTTSCFRFSKDGSAVENLKDVLLDPEVLNAKNWRGGKLTIQYGDKGKDKDFWCFLQTSDWVMGDLFINTKHVKDGEITSWKDLLKPKYKGKIMAHDPQRPGAGQATAAYLYSRFGENFVRQLYIGQDATLGTSYGKNPEAVARGKYWIGIAFVQGPVQRLIKKGLPIKRIFPKDGMGLMTGGFGGIAKINGGPNPNAGYVFVNWWASKRGQEVAQCMLMESSLRADTTNSQCVPNWVKPKAGVGYPVHDYDPAHHFGAKKSLADNVTKIFGK